MNKEHVECAAGLPHLPSVFGMQPCSLDGPEVLQMVKDYLKKGEDALKAWHRRGASGGEIVRANTALIDNFIKALYEKKSDECRREAGKESASAIAALGGYGRAELNIRSDIDMMLVYSGRLTPYTETLAQKMMYLLWDSGLDVGFSIRSVKECILLAKDDLKTKTALMDARFLTGGRAVFDELIERSEKEVFREKSAEAFLKEKLEESRARHAKYGGSVYILEPNVKEGEGGLRDIHTAMWIARIKHGIKDIDMLADRGFLLRDAADRLSDSIDFLWRVRNELHFECKKKTDQLTFDHQERISKLFGFDNTKESLAVEKFMHQYYRHASNISYFASLIISRCLHGTTSAPPLHCRSKKDIDADFYICDGSLTLLNENVFEESPEKIMKAFEHSRSFRAEMDNFTREKIIKNRARIDGEFINSKRVGGYFLNIMRSGMAFEALQEMHRLKCLERYIPEFGDITCRVQHDMYHVYTVDTHSLFAVRELERLRTEEYKKAFPLLSDIYSECKSPALIAMTVLLHDIGKSMGKGHAEKGAEMIQAICGRIGLAENEISMIRFLVKNHLILADTAQYRDLHDEKLIIEFARTVGDVERLNLLYLLTFADVRAVGPDVWNQWKGTLFQELYFKTLTIMERGSFEPEDAMKKLSGIMAETSRLLEGELPQEIVEDYFQLLPHRYFLVNSVDTIAEHIRIVQQLQGRSYTLNVRQNTEREYTEVIICTLDVHGLFSKITGVMAANNINILGAQINTLRNGVILDVLQVNSSLGTLITDERKWANVEKDLADVLEGRVRVENLVARKGPSILDRKAKPKTRTRIEIDNEISDVFTVIDIHTQDRIGLLYTITSALSRLSLYIYIAKITTKGEAAADIFYVKDIFGQKIYYKERLKEIRRTIFEALGEEMPKEE